MAVIIPIRPDFLTKVRQDGLDDQNQPVVHLIAKGGEPCRDSFRRAKAGEKLILASYCPFSHSGPYREYGPVFINATESNTSPDLSRLPFTSCSGPAYLSQPLVLRAYRRDETIADAELVNEHQARTALARFFADRDVHFVLARFAAYGCYALRVERG